MSNARKISCGQASRLLQARLDGPPAPPQEELLQAHWQRCPACAERARQMLAAVQALRSAPAPEPRVPLAARIRAAAAQAMRETPTPAPRLRVTSGWAVPALAAAALLMVLLATHSPFPRAHVASRSSQPSPRVALAPSAPAPAAPSLPALAPAPAPPVRVAALPTAPAAASPSYHLERVEQVSLPRGGSRAAAPAPHSAYVHSRDPMLDTNAAQPTDNGADAAPQTARMARVDEPTTPPESDDNSGDFANEVVGGLVADVVLSSYLEGAPANLKVSPAVLNTGSGE